MPTPTHLQSELDRIRGANSARMETLVEQQYNTEITRPFALRFTADTQSDAQGLMRLLFAKGLRLITPEPVEASDGSWRVEVGAKHNLREMTAEDFVCDLVTVASGVHACFEGWEFLSDDAAELTQQHAESPERKP